MTKLSNEQKTFIKKAIVSTQVDLPGLNPDNNDDLLLIINTFRSKGYITPRSIDGGNEMDMWRDIRNALGQPIKSREDTIKEQKEQEAIGLLRKLGESHDKKIRLIEEQLKIAKQNKEDSYRAVETNLDNELIAINKKKKELLAKSKVAKRARARIKMSKQVTKLKKEADDIVKKRGAQKKCWHCGEWFTAGIGFINHEKSCKEKDSNKITQVL